MQVITDDCDKIAVLEICSEKNTRESEVGTFENICTVAVHCWYIKDAFAGFSQQIFEKKYFRWHFRKNWGKAFATLSRFWLLRGWGWLEEPIKKKKTWDRNPFQIISHEVIKSCKNNDIC